MEMQQEQTVLEPIFLSSICRIKHRIERKLLDQEATVAAAL